MNKIMIIEDDLDFRKTLCSVLFERFPAFSLLEAGSGEEAIEQMGLFAPDLVLTDIGLPGENGFQIIRRIRKEYPKVGILVLTVHQDLEYEEAAYAAGANVFASKHKTSADDIFKHINSLLMRPLRKPPADHFAAHSGNRGDDRGP